MSRLQRTVYWPDWLFGKGEDKCLQATHKADTISTHKSARTSSPLFYWRVSNVSIPSNKARK